MIREGQRIVLREYRQEDVEAVWAYSHDPEVTRFTVWPPNDRSSTEAFVNRAIAASVQEPRQVFELAVADRRSDRVLGGARLTIRSTLHQVGDVGYVIHRECWGQGLAGEAVRLLLELGFTSLSLHRIEATCDPDNVRSRRVLEKAGFQWEGYLRQHLWVQGRRRDSLLFGLLAPDWYCSRNC